jgi:isoamylase
VHSSGATSVEVCIFDASGEREIGRLALPERSDDVWHGFLPAPHGVPGLVYGLRAHGPYDPPHGLRYNGSKLLLDPYARALVGKFQWHPALIGHGENDRPDPADSAPYNYKARVIDGAFDWGDDIAPSVPWRDTVIYELHVKGFTKLHPLVPERERGKYLGLARPEVIAHLKQLGVTAV